MDNYIDKIYKLMYSPIITPYNLLENIKLDNYAYVNYYKGYHGITSELKCTTDDGIETIFYYNFDGDDRLYNVYMELDSVRTLVFDRKTELIELKSQFRSDYYKGDEIAL